MEIVVVLFVVGFFIALFAYFINDFANSVAGIAGIIRRLIYIKATGQGVTVGQIEEDGIISEVYDDINIHAAHDAIAKYRKEHSSWDKLKRWIHTLAYPEKE